MRFLAEGRWCVIDANGNHTSECECAECEEWDAWISQWQAEKQTYEILEGE